MGCWSCLCPANFPISVFFVVRIEYGFYEREKGEEKMRKRCGFVAIEVFNVIGCRSSLAPRISNFRQIGDPSASLRNMIRET